MTDATDFIAEAITEHFGERCPDYAEGCAACDAWKQYDDLRALTGTVRPVAVAWEDIQDAIDKWAKDEFPGEDASEARGCITSWSDLIAQAIVERFAPIQPVAVADEPAWGPAVRQIVAESHASLFRSLDTSGLSAATAAVTAEIDRYWRDDTVRPGHALVAEKAVRAYLGALTGTVQPVAVGGDALGDMVLEALEHAREKMWTYGFSENDLQPIRQAIEALAPAALAVPGGCGGADAMVARNHWKWSRP